MYTTRWRDCAMPRCDSVSFVIGNERRRRARVLQGAILALAVLASPALGAERELDDNIPPSSAKEIETPIQRMFPEEPVRPPLFPWARNRLQKLPAFFADTVLEARFRTYYLRQDRAFPVGGDDGLSEAWAMGGSIYYRSGWLEDLLSVEVEGFTSQPVVAPEKRGGTGLLAPGQDGYSVLGIANGKLRYKGLVLTGFRQFLDLPYVNRNDSRMTPNTFEAVSLAKPEGRFRFFTGYSWKIKRRNSDEFQSFTEAPGVKKDRGFAYLGTIWDPNESFHAGVYAGAVPDVQSKLYVELGLMRALADGAEGRLDGQFTYQWQLGDDLLGAGLDDSWNLGLRSSVSLAGAVFRLGLGITGPDAPIVSPYGTSPSYVDLMQQTFNRANEKALLASITYDFGGLGLDGLSSIVNFAAGFDGERLGVSGDRQEVDVTIDYRVEKGWLRHFWLRVRGSWLNEELRNRDGTDFRAIVNYDIPVI